MKAKATLKQIAKELNVSISTVSKALSNSPEISEPTKKKIQEFAKLKQYKPNNIAINLKNRRTKTIGVIIPNILNSFFAKVFTGIEKTANEKGYNVITCISNEIYEKEVYILNMLSNGTIDGFILSIAEETQKKQEFKHFDEIIKGGVPIVMFDRISKEVLCDKVIVDDFDSAVHATQHLINLKCKNIALLSTIDNLSVGKLRFEGYLKAFENNNLKINNNLILKTDSVEDFNQKLVDLFNNHSIDSIYAIDEHASVHAMKTAIKKGFKIPEELCIIGVADGVWSRRMTPSLSTVSQHGIEIGKVAVEKLIEKLENRSEAYTYTTTIIKTELRQRDSTRKLS